MTLTLESPATSYEQFLAAKAQNLDDAGFTPTDLPAHLYDFQHLLVDWAVRKGRAALFADCGMGKTPMELAYADQVFRKTGKPVLLLTPLAVGFQVVQEAEKFGHDAAMSRTGKPTAPITVTNYEQLGKFDTNDFGGVICDESSAIKSFEGTTRAQVTEFMRTHAFRLLGTATAAPNDYIELGTSAEALGSLGHMDMLTRFFTNKQRTQSSRGRGTQGDSVQWRLKGHAEEPFWRWVSSWARAIRHPSDYGFPDDRFVLPELIEREHVMAARVPDPDSLFDMPAHGLREERAESRRTLEQRCETAATKLAAVESGVAWCHLNDESSLLTRLIDGAVEVAGSDSPDAKEEKLAAFSRGEIRVLVTKPSIGAWGLNWQHCNNMTYFPSHSYEQYYQSVRRSWRFGQTKPVTVDLITTEGGKNVLKNLRRKAGQADEMFSQLVTHMNHAIAVDPHTYDKELELPPWLVSSTK
ncbi:DEAD/DEAH box helicase [Arthrobacter sp. GMC3]|uniref:DEAD/DEAH box helicase n=1 Tax=Arthrobacter sp. GMC3 TaxID=2058894 RepID=UPI000CE5387C|nr:DEAD/DEAH box helicase [Arthrobacter sp. GMC3]